MTTDNFYFYLQNRLIQVSQTGGQQCSDTSPFSIPWLRLRLISSTGINHDDDHHMSINNTGHR